MRLLTIMIYLGMLFFVKAFASDSEASKDCPLTYNGITQRIQTILASHQPSFSSSQVQKKDKGYIVFLLKNEFKAEKGNPGYSPRYYEIIVELFLLNETEYLRLLWWETEDSTTRLLIMSARRGIWMRNDALLRSMSRRLLHIVSVFNQTKPTSVLRKCSSCRIILWNCDTSYAPSSPIARGTRAYKTFVEK